VLEKIVGEMHARVQARKTKEVTRRKNALESASMPAKLSDSQPGNDDIAELFIVEGDSALGTAKAAREFDVSGPAAHPRQDSQRAEGIAFPDALQ
jgi:DNA gyrase subunit B